MFSSVSGVNFFMFSPHLTPPPKCINQAGRVRRKGRGRLRGRCLHDPGLSRGAPGTERALRGGRGWLTDRRPADG